jgi:hypothetical protein
MPKLIHLHKGKLQCREKKNLIKLLNWDIIPKYYGYTVTQMKVAKTE